MENDGFALLHCEIDLRENRQRHAVLRVQKKLLGEAFSAEHCCHDDCLSYVVLVPVDDSFATSVSGTQDGGRQKLSIGMMGIVEDLIR